MYLFHWDSQALKQYRTGDIFAMAADIEAARQLVREKAIDWLKEHRSWYFEPGDTDVVSADEREDYDAWMALLDKDLAREAVVECCVLISGSE